MSVVIKGMKMPSNCMNCPLSFLRGERLFCEVTKEEVLRAKIASECPIIELPSHGRLIDADALEAGYFIPSTTTNSSCQMYVSLETIATAPTILEAEVE